MASLKNTHSASSRVEYSNYSKVKKWAKNNATRMSRNSAKVDIHRLLKLEDGVKVTNRPRKSG